MRSTLDELERELDELRDFLASIAHVGEALSTHPDPEVRRFAALRRRFDNAAFVVALYATFESYVEKLVAAFATLEAQRLPYVDLPQKLAAKHLQRSADLLARGRLGEGRHAGLTPAGVVANLYNCLTGVTPYALNAAAVVWHDNNLRAKDVDEIFLHLGIEDMCTQVRRGDALMQWYMAAQGIETPPAKGVPSTVIEERLNDLVERRNEVAHRGGNPEDLLGRQRHGRGDRLRPRVVLRHLRRCGGTLSWRPLWSQLERHQAFAGVRRWAISRRNGANSARSGHRARNRTTRIRGAPVGPRPLGADSELEPGQSGSPVHCGWNAYASRNRGGPRLRLLVKVGARCSTG